jgi:hypothetical protein
MPELTYTLPPYAEPRITLSRTPSPVREGSDPPDALISGVELIVSELPRNDIASAANYLRAVLGDHSLQYPSDPLVPVRIVPGDERNSVDYVFVSVDPAVTQEPRPDLLERMRILLTSVHGLRASWRDRTRRIHFQVDSFAQAEALHPKLSTHLNGRGCPFQCSFVSKAMNRITFDLLDRASVDNLFKAPPVIDHQTLYPSVPRYIQPVYALEVGIFGVKDVLRAAPVIDHYIKSKYGNVIASSRLALNGDAYCVVFNTWAQTSRFLFDPFTAFDSGFGVSHSVSQALPALLYVLNSNDLPFSARPPHSSSTSLRQLQAQFDMLQHKVDTWARALEALVAQQEHMLQQLQYNAQNTAVSIAKLSTVMSGSARLQAATSRLEALQSDAARTSQLLLAIAPPDRSNAIVQYLESEISAHRTAVAQAQDSLSAAEQLLPPPSLPLPAPTPHAASSSQHLRTWALEDLHADNSGDARRRLRTRTDAGPYPPRDDSPIHVDPVTHFTSLFGTSTPTPTNNSVPPITLQKVTASSHSSCTLLSHLCHLTGSTYLENGCRHHAKPGVRGTLNRDTLLRDSNLTLPPHLRYLLHL